ncbi:unnamed protein product [Trichobilharzia szidati]|nr:unnamed protein product [Trichobilharzia szidati]
MTKSTLGTISKFGDTADQRVKTACKLSIGHLFHLISLDEDSIAVTSYRQIDKIIKIAYSYALQVPDAKSYVSLNTNFTNDSTVILNWNYLDNYLCNRGISDSFRLLPNLKFWRSRFFILPIYSNETRRLTEAIRDNTTGSRIPCDVFESDYTNMNREKTCERFVHFIESVNRIRRTVIPSRKINRQSVADKPDAYRTSTCNLPSSNTLSDSSMPTTPIYCVTTGAQKLNKTGSLTTAAASTHTIRSSTIISPSIIGLCNESSNEGSNSKNSNISTNTVQPTGGGGTAVQTNVPPIDDCQSTTSLPNLLGIFYQSSEDQSSQPSQTSSSGNMSTGNIRSSLNSITTPYSIVAFMMADNENGLPFILASTTNAFPDYTFISIDAVNWVIKWFLDIGTIEQAVIYLQQLIEAGWLCHTSGNPKHAFIYGTYFYTLLIPDLKQSGSCASNELPISLSTSDSNELSITHSAPVTPVQSNACLSANSTTPTTNVNSFVGSVTATNTMACCSTSTSTHSCSVALSSNTGGSLSTISTITTTSTTATTTTANINTTNTPVTTTTTTTNNSSNSSSTSASTASIVSSTLLNPTVSNLTSINNNSFANQSNIDLSLQPSSFPKGYIPKLSNDSSKWTCVFQNEWAEIAIVYYDGTDGQQLLSRQQMIRGEKCTNLNDSPSTADTTPPPPATTTTTVTTSTTTTTNAGNSSQTNDSSLSPLPSSSSSCSTPRIQCKTSTEKDCFMKDGLLKYSLISSLFGIPDKTGFQEIDQILRKSCLCDMDEPDDDGRVEWAHCVYDANYHPTCAFSIELQWLVVTGGRMAELVALWHQKAGAANLHFFPVPCFPFNQSDNDFLSDKDPLRKPIFLPININVLIETVETIYSTEKNTHQHHQNNNLSLKCKAKGVNSCSDMNLIDILEYLFPDIPYAERLTCIRCFQDSILRRFGFISDNCDKDRLNYELHGRRAFISCNSPKQWIYVHCSGGIFTMIPLYDNFDEKLQSDETIIDNTDILETSNGHNTEGTPTTTTENMTADSFKDDRRTPTSRPTATTGKNATETLSDRSNNCYLLQTSLGYFWAWNHMLPRRWRGHLTGDESFQDGMLADFRAFVNGEDNRLSQYFSQFIKSLANY